MVRVCNNSFNQPTRSPFFCECGCARFLLPAEGESTIVCNEDFAVFQGSVHITDPLVPNGFISCNYTHLLTADDVNNLERRDVVNVRARDGYDYEVEASVTEVVSFSQVSA